MADFDRLDTRCRLAWKENVLIGVDSASTSCRKDAMMIQLCPWITRLGLVQPTLGAKPCLQYYRLALLEDRLCWQNVQQTGAWG